MTQTKATLIRILRDNNVFQRIANNEQTKDLISELLNFLETVKASSYRDGHLGGIREIENHVEHCPTCEHCAFMRQINRIRAIKTRIAPNRKEGNYERSKSSIK